MLQTKALVLHRNACLRLGGDLTQTLFHAQWFPISTVPSPKGRVREQFLHMLHTFHALKQKHTWAISQVVSIACIFRNPSTVRWGGNLCYFWCSIIGPAEPVLTRLPCIKILGFRMQIVPRWRTVKKEAMLGPVSWLKLGESTRFISPSFGSCTARIQEETTNKLTSSAWGAHGSQPSLHIFPICAILGERQGQPFILGGFIPTYNGLAQLHNILALWPGKQQMEIPNINVLDYHTVAWQQPKEQGLQVS